MKIGTSLALIAVGLILAYAVEFEIPGIEIDTLGAILFYIGLLGLALTIGLEIHARRAHSPRPPRAPRRREREPEPPPRARRPDRTFDPIVPPHEQPRDLPGASRSDDRTRRL